MKNAVKTLIFMVFAFIAITTFAQQKTTIWYGNEKVTYVISDMPAVPERLGVVDGIISNAYICKNVREVFLSNVVVFHDSILSKVSIGESTNDAVAGSYFIILDKTIDSVLVAGLNAGKSMILRAPERLNLSQQGKLVKTYAMGLKEEERDILKKINAEKYFSPDAKKAKRAKVKGLKSELALLKEENRGALATFAQNVRESNGVIAVVYSVNTVEAFMSGKIDTSFGKVKLANTSQDNVPRPVK